MTAPNNTPAPTKPPMSMANFVSTPKAKEFLNDVLEEDKKEFVTNLIALTDNDKNLAECNPADLMKVAMNATALSLSLNKALGYAYCVAYKGKATFIIGYKGYLQLAMRSGSYEYINAVEVREGEMIRNKFTGELKFNKENPDGKIVGYVAFLKQLNGFKASVYMTEEQMEAYALKYSAAYKSDIQYKSHRSLWSDPDERIKMALKTVLRQLLTTYGLFSTKIQQAMANDATDEEEPLRASRTVEDAEVVTQADPDQAPKPEHKPKEKVHL